MPGAATAPQLTSGSTRRSAGGRRMKEIKSAEEERRSVDDHRCVTAQTRYLFTRGDTSTPFSEHSPLDVDIRLLYRTLINHRQRPLLLHSCYSLSTTLWFVFLKSVNNVESIHSSFLKHKQQRRR